MKMALYDEYFTNEDKPFAENLNDALLLSNVFDMTVPIQMPKMFSNSAWVSTTSPRKCAVAIATLKEGLPSGISVGTDSTTGGSTLSGTGTLELSFYPNFNSFGSYKSMTWENTGTIIVNLKTSEGTTIASNIQKGSITSQSSELKTLQEIIIEIVFTNATLKSFEVVMENKQSERYGAEVGITDVNGLETRLTGIESTVTSQGQDISRHDAVIDILDESVDNLNSAVDSVKQWTQVTDNTKFTVSTGSGTTGALYVNEDLRLAHLTMVCSKEYAVGENVTGVAFPSSDYRPSSPIFPMCHNSGQFIAIIPTKTDSNIVVKIRKTTTGNATVTTYINIIYAY